MWPYGLYGCGGPVAWALSLHFAWQASMKHGLAADEVEGTRPQTPACTERSGWPPGRLFPQLRALVFISGAEWGQERTPAL